MSVFEVKVSTDHFLVLAAGLKCACFIEVGYSHRVGSKRPSTFHTMKVDPGSLVGDLLERVRFRPVVQKTIVELSWHTLTTCLSVY